MRKMIALTIIVLIACAVAAQGESEDGYISRAKLLMDSGDLHEAVTVLEKAAAEFPGSSDIHAYLGFYTGMRAGRTQDYAEAGQLVALSFELLDKAVSLDSTNVQAYLMRGIMGINVPKFLGRLDGGIADLQRIVSMHGSDPESVGTENLLIALRTLAEGYTNSENTGKAKETLQKIVDTAPGTDAARRAKEQIASLAAPKAAGPDVLSAGKDDSKKIAELKKTIKNEPENANLLLELGRTYYEAGSYADAVEVLKLCVAKDETNPSAYKLLGLSVARIAEEGYDDKIHDDTNYRSELAFQSMGYMDRAVELDPDDFETRLTRGIFGIMFPFFVGKHDQGVNDLEYVTAGDATESQKAEALYYLGVAHQRRAMRYWIEVATKYEKSDATRMVYESMHPLVGRFDPRKHEKPVMAIDFVLGFQDELPPQTAIWIESSEGNYICTVYVSGFSGHAKEQQVNLPVWSAVSGYEGIDDVTGASIDVGHYIHTWDVRDRHGNRVPPGRYTVKVEVSYWPSMKYQLAETAIEVGAGDGESIVEEGDFIPYLLVTYHARP